MRRHILTWLLMVCGVACATAQDFFNLTAEEVKIDSMLPVWHYAVPLDGDYADTLYTVSIDYPEFIDMSAADIRRYQQITTDTLPVMPRVESVVTTSRKKGTLHVSLVPLVYRGHRYQKLVSFQLNVHARPSLKASSKQSASIHRRAGEDTRYADHSVLASGSWAKIRVPETGIYQLTENLVRQAGFTDINRVKIYGYGGAMQPEVLTGDYLSETDDLQEVPSCIVNNRRLFHAVGPVSWQSPSERFRTRNPYSDYGYYFLTESDTEPLTLDSAAFMAACYPLADDYHSLWEEDAFAWYHSGRNLYQNDALTTTAKTYQLNAHATSGELTVILTCHTNFTASVALNGISLGNMTYNGTFSQYLYGAQSVKTFSVDNLNIGQNDISLQLMADADVHLDYIALAQSEPAAAPSLATYHFPSPQYVYRITNQDHHADTPVDMVIIVPTSQKWISQAERLKTLHEQYDGLRVRIVPADELYNEFSSGTPDANAYRRYLKMLYDRAENEGDMPRYLLLFGSGFWDNRLLTSSLRHLSADDYLLCYEDENSFSATDSYVSDDYFCLLDDGEGGDLPLSDTPDVGVGRLPATSESDAKIMVDKIYAYRLNEYAGDWQNVVCFIGDDGNNNVHMEESDAAAKLVESTYLGYNVKRVFFDAYDRVSSSTGNRYPDVERLIKQQMRQGALIIDYCGHGAPYSISHEQVLLLNDFGAQTSLRLPLWVTASCDIMPFDAHEDNIGEKAMLNPHGGAIAFYGTTRTVYVGANKDMNCSFIKHALETVDGRQNTLGDAVRLAKGEVFHRFYKYNKLHYSLLGDPALALATPTREVVIDSINGRAVSDDVVALAAGSIATVKGHVAGDSQFNGVVTLTVKDVKQTIVCKLNNTGDDGASVAYQYQDRPTILYNGSDSIRAGQFTISFALPQDISYSDALCQMTAYALNNSRSEVAHGENTRFTVSTSSEMANDGIGPSIYCYLNSTSFVNGGAVNPTPYFFAQLTDKEGINAAGSGFGHDMELVIDGDQMMTFNLNPYFQYDFGDYHTGSVGYSLPELDEGEHTLLFRAWDILNNPSVAQLTFHVVRGLMPGQFSVECTKNPARTSTSFVINHDRIGSTMDVELEVFDTSGRMLYRQSETGVSTDNTYIVDWDLTVEGGSRLQTGVYLYRVLISSDGSKKASQAQKLIILRN